MIKGDQFTKEEREQPSTTISVEDDSLSYIIRNLDNGEVRDLRSESSFDFGKF